MSDSRKDMPRLPDTITLSEIADALDTLADIMVSDQTDELAGYKASFWRDAALHLCCLAGDQPSEEIGPSGSRREPKR
jgi:hypothetical protein